MKAIRVEQIGGPDVLCLRDIADFGPPGPGQVLVRIAAAGVNFMDVNQRRGVYPRPVPFTPGVEASGIVEAVGEGVECVKPMDRVAYSGPPGAYAEASVVEAKRLIPLPDDFSFEQGAAFPLQGITAHYLLHEFRKPKPGDVVLVHAAAGGVGLLLVQWARHLGARVLGTVSSGEKVLMAREAGIEKDDVILYTERDFATEVKRLTGGHGADVIIDGVGKTTFAGNLEAAAVRGHIVCYGMASGRPDPVRPHALMQRALTISGGSPMKFSSTAEEMLRRADEVIRAVREGWLTLNIDRVFPLAQASEAHRLLENRKTMGKIVLAAVPADGPYA